LCRLGRQNAHLVANAANLGQERNALLSSAS
jgi:hypothetical protein